MNTSRLAPWANLGGALLPSRSARQISARNSFGLDLTFPEVSLRGILVLGFSFLSAIKVLCAPAITLAWDSNSESDVVGYKLAYGTSSGNYSSVVNAGPNTEASVTGLVEGTTYFFAVAAVNSTGIQSPYSSEVSYLVTTTVITNPAGWTLQTVDSQESPAYQGFYAIDGDPNTFWHTAWSGNPTAPPHEIQINLGNSQKINGFRYLPRQDSSLVGTVGAFEFFISPDGVNWGNPVATGTFANTHDLKEVRFAETTGKYIMLRGLTDANGGIYMTVAELGIIQDSTTGPGNHPPVASSASISTPEDTPVVIVLEGSDVDGDVLNFSLVAAPSKGNLSGTPPNLNYTPSANFHGTDSFTFLVNDGAADSTTATISIAVSPVNDAPVVANKALSTAEDLPLAITLTGTDLDGDALSFSIVSNPGKGTLSGALPNLTYTPNPGFSGNDQFIFRAFDGLTNSASATVSINVTAINHAPVAVSKSLGIPEDNTLQIILGASDPDGNNLTFIVDTSPGHGTLSGTAPNLTYTPFPNYHGTDSFTFFVNDGSLDSATATISIAVSSINDAPVVASKTVLTLEEQPLPISLTASDVDGDALTYLIVNNPLKGTLAGSPPNLTYIPNPGFSGTDQFTFKAFDGISNSGTATVTINVTPISHAPVALSKSVTTPEDAPIAIVIGATDSDGDSLTYVIASNPSHGTVSGTAPNLTYIPSANFNGSDKFTFRASDGALESEIATISITVTPINDAPVVANTSVTTQQDSSLEITLTGADVDGDTLTFFIVNNPTRGTLVGTIPNLTYVPSPGFSGNDQFTFRARDAVSNSANATVSITVTPKVIPSGNVAPAFANGTIRNAATEDQSYAGYLSATDADGDALTFGKVSGPSWLTVSTTGRLGGIPLNEDVGNNTFLVKVEDPSKASATATLVITVANTNDAPSFKLNSFTYPEGSEKSPYGGSLDLTATDPDVGDTLDYSKKSGPRWLSISPDGTFTGTPARKDVGTNEFTIRVTDSDGASADAILIITVNRNSLPAPWKLDKVGGDSMDPAIYSAGVFTMGGTGSISEKSDATTFGWQKLSGDGSIIARVKSIDNTGKETRIGLMIRQSLASDSRQAFLGVDSKGKLHWIKRTKNGGSSSDLSRKGNKTDNSWLKLTREGKKVIAYRSSNGTIWRKVGSTTLKLPKNCYIGLSVSSGDDSVRNTSKFSNVRVKP